MYTIKCAICGKEFNHEMKGRELMQLGRHLKKEHNITPEQYVLKYEYDNVPPKCACGCGNITKYSKWKFLKYYKDHKNSIKVSEDTKIKISKTLKYNANQIDFLDKFKINIKDLKYWFDEYNKETSNKEYIHNISGIDFRTIKKMWLYYDITTNESLKRLSYLHQHVWGNKGEKNGSYKEIDEYSLKKALDLLINNKNKLTCKRLINILDLDVSEWVLKKRLIEQFSEDVIIKLLSSGNSSKMELEFYYILKYFFGVKNIKRQFKLENKIYDFLLYDKLLIEFDGEYWHKDKKENDKLKDDIAINNGYIIYRVSDKTRKNINHFLKIKEILNEI